VKMVKDAHEKAGDDAHWGMYRLMFGGEGGTFVALSGDPSMSAIDDGFTGQKRYLEALGGEEGMEKLNALFGAAVDTSHSELFDVNPKQSYVSEDWLKKDAGLEAQGRSGQQVSQSLIHWLIFNRGTQSNGSDIAGAGRSFLVGESESSDHFKLSFPKRKSILSDPTTRCP
jgi:hypothetical protein